MNSWEQEAHLSGDETEDVLYKKALNEDILKVYTVSTRATQVKEGFEAAYPGLYVEIKDLRSPELIQAVSDTVDSREYDADIVICNDNSGAFKQTLVDTGKVYAYIPDDIRDKMKDGYIGETVTFLDEAELLFYNGSKYDSCPIDNLWELTEEKYRGRIIMPSPMRSFSTYAFCGAVLCSEEALFSAYKDYAGSEPALKEGSNAAELFIEKLFENTIFSNSSDEVVEGLGSGDERYDFGIMVSSKMRFNEIGYKLEPVYELDPFSGARISYAVMIAAGSKNVNCAKLFIRYLLGEGDGSGEGYKPFQTVGTWSARKDVDDITPVALSGISLLTPDQDQIISKKEYIDQLLSELLENE